MEPQKNKLVKEYESLKEEINQLRSEETLKKWEILSKAYRLGKEIYGNHFTVLTLSIDFDIPFSTVKRCLSLDRANSKTWDLIKSKKISAFKVAMVCLSRKFDEQDNIVKIIIEKNLSTYEIRKLCRAGNVNAKKLEILSERGYQNKSNGYVAVITTLKRIDKMSMLNKNHFNQKNVKDLVSKSRETIENLKRFINNLSGEKVLNDLPLYN